MWNIIQIIKEQILIELSRSVAMLSVGTVSARNTKQINLLVILRSSTRTVPTGVFATSL